MLDWNSDMIKPEFGNNTFSKVYNFSNQVSEWIPNLTVLEFWTILPYIRQKSEIHVRNAESTV